MGQIPAPFLQFSLNANKVIFVQSSETSSTIPFCMCEMNTLASQQMSVNSSRQSMSWAFRNHLSKETLNCLQFCSNHSRGASAKWFKDRREL